MTTITPSRNFIQQEETGFEAPVSEGTLTRIGAASNYLMDRTFFKEDFVYGGFFHPNSYDAGYTGIRYIKNESRVLDYYISVGHTGIGISGVTGNTFNIAVYSSEGVFVNNLFGSGDGSLSVSVDSRDNVIIGMKNLEKSPTLISVNSGQSLDTSGTLNIPVIPSGSMLVPFIEDSGVGAYNLFFSMRLGEL